jgi:hypothetical protein
LYFFQDENADISSQSVADSGRTELNSTDSWKEVDSVSTKQNENLVASLMHRISY